MSTGPRPCLWARTVRCESPHRPRPPWACGHIHRHIGSPSRHSGARFHHCDAPTTRCPNNRHSGASRNLCPPTTVIPAPAGIYAPHPTVIPAPAGIDADTDGAFAGDGPLQPSFRRQPESMPPYNRHSGAAGIHVPLQPTFRRQLESIPSYNRHSGASQNLCPPTTVIPAPAGIYAVADGAFAGDGPLQPSFRLAPESMLAGSITVVGDYDAGFRRKPE